MNNEVFLKATLSLLDITSGINTEIAAIMAEADGGRDEKRLNQIKALLQERKVYAEATIAVTRERMAMAVHNKEILEAARNNPELFLKFMEALENE